MLTATIMFLLTTLAFVELAARAPVMNEDVAIGVSVGEPVETVQHPDELRSLTAHA